MFTRYLKLAIILIAAAITMPSIARADDLDKAVTLLKAGQQALFTANSASADVYSAQTQGETTIRKSGVMECMKPNMLRFELWPIPAGKKVAAIDETVPHDLAVTDGKTLYTSGTDDLKTIRERPATAHGGDFNSVNDFAWPDFFDTGSQSIVTQLQTSLKNVHLTTETWGGTACTVINSDFNVPGMPASIKPPKLKIYLGPDDIIRRLIVSGTGVGIEVSMTDVRVNPTLTETDFAFSVPKYATEAKAPIDPRAFALLTQVDQAMSTTQALKATVHTESTFETKGIGTPSTTVTESIVKLLRPNYAFIDTYAIDNSATPPTRKETSLDDCDGVNVWTISDFKAKTYTKSPVSPFNRLGGQQIGPLSKFFLPWLEIVGMDSSDQSVSISLKGEQTWNGAQYKVVEIRQNMTTAGAKMVVTYTLFIDQDAIVRRLVQSTVADDSTSTSDSSIVTMDPKATLAAADFAYKPPAGMKVAAEPVEPARSQLLAQGVAAPNFTVRDRAGKPVRLSDFKGRVVVLDFWATWCGPCQASLPSTNEVAKRFLKRHVIVLGVNVWDTKDAFQAWLPQHKDYNAIRFAIDPSPGGKDVASTLYNVSGIPTQYVIDRRGKIVWSTDGFSGSDDDLIAAVNKALR